MKKSDSPLLVLLKTKKQQKSIMMMMMMQLFLLFLVGLTSTRIVDAMPPTYSYGHVVKLPSLEWTNTNKLFKDTSNTGSNYYLKLTGHIGDSIDLICPSRSHEHSSAYYSVIYKVATRHEFDNCVINPNNEETFPILKCDRPNSVVNIAGVSPAPPPVKFTIYFVKFSPVPNALEFEEDKEYFFVSTSSGTRDGLGYMSGGLCSKYNMRFSIRIKSNTAEIVSTSRNKSSSNVLAKLMSKKDDISSVSNNNNDLISDSREKLDEDDEVSSSGEEDTLQPQVSKLNLVVSSAVWSSPRPTLTHFFIYFILVFCILFKKELLV